MSIVSSTVTVEGAQKDGRFWVHEIHTDNLSRKWLFDYLAGAGFNFNALLAARAAALPAQQAAAEIASNLADVTTNGSLASPVFNYSIVADNVAALRALYATATQMQAVMAGDYLNTLTSLQLQNAFGLTAGQVTTLRANKLTPAATLAASIRASAGQ